MSSLLLCDDPRTQRSGGRRVGQRNRSRLENMPRSACVAVVHSTSVASAAQAQRRRCCAARCVGVHLFAELEPARVPLRVDRPLTRRPATAQPAPPQVPRNSRSGTRRLARATSRKPAMTLVRPSKSTQPEIAQRLACRSRSRVPRARRRARAQPPSWCRLAAPVAVADLPMSNARTRRHEVEQRRVATPDGPPLREMRLRNASRPCRSPHRRGADEERRDSPALHTPPCREPRARATPASARSILLTTTTVESASRSAPTMRRSMNERVCGGPDAATTMKMRSTFAHTMWPRSVMPSDEQFLSLILLLDRPPRPRSTAASPEPTSLGSPHRHHRVGEHRPATESSS